MSRLLTLMLLYQSGYLVGKYISLEMLIEKTKESYYDVLESSSVNWHDSNNNYAPFIKYYLGILSASYVDFESRIKYLTDRSLSKPDRILEIITQRVGKITKRELIDLCPDISKVTIERTLTTLAQSGQILKLGSGRATYYIKNRK